MTHLDQVYQLQLWKAFSFRTEAEGFRVFIACHSSNNTDKTHFYSLDFQNSKYFGFDTDFISIALLFFLNLLTLLKQYGSWMSFLPCSSLWWFLILHCTVCKSSWHSSLATHKNIYTNTNVTLFWKKEKQKSEFQRWSSSNFIHKLSFKMNSLPPRKSLVSGHLLTYFY